MTQLELIEKMEVRKKKQGYDSTYESVVITDWIET